MSKILKYSAELGEDGAAYSKELCPYGQTAGDRNVVMGLGSYSCSKCRFCELRDPFEQVVKCKFEVLDLSLAYHWFDEIAAGRKLEEYRELTDYYRSRLTFPQWRGTDIFKHYDAVRFHRGQGSPTTMLVECIGIRIGYGREEWGAPKGKQVFVIQLGDILERAKQ